MFVITSALLKETFFEIIFFGYYYNEAFFFFYFNAINAYTMYNQCSIPIHYITHFR